MWKILQRLRRQTVLFVTVEFSPILACKNELKPRELFSIDWHALFLLN